MDSISLKSHALRNDWYTIIYFHKKHKYYFFIAMYFCRRLLFILTILKSVKGVLKKRKILQFYFSVRFWVLHLLSYLNSKYTF